MASLTEVVEELKGQNDTLEDVKSALKGMLDIDLQKQKDEAAQELIDKENAIEARRSKAQRGSSAPKTFAGGVASGLGVTDIFDSMKNALGGIGAGFGGMLGGMTLGSLLGKALGKLFVVGAGAYLGSKVFDDEVVNKFIPDAIENIKIGDFTLGDFSAEIAGALALLFGPKIIGKLLPLGFSAISTTLSDYFTKAKPEEFLDAEGKKKVNDSSKKGKTKLTKNLVGKIGILGLLGYVGTIVGEEVGKLTGSDELGSAVSAAAQGAALGAMFGPKGAIIGAAIGLAYVAGSMLYNWMAGKREEAATKLKEDLEKQNKEFTEALESGDLEAASQVLDNRRIQVDNLTNEGVRDAYTQFSSQRYDLADALADSGQIELANKKRHEAAMMGFMNTTDPDEKIRILKDFQKLTGLDKTTAIERLNPNYKSMYANPDTTLADMFRALPDKFVDATARPDNFDNTSMPAPPKSLVVRDLEAELMKQSVAPGNQGERDIEEFLRTGKFPEYTGPATPAVNMSDGEISSGVVKQTITAEDAQIVNNNNVVINNIDYSDRKQTSVVKGGDTPIHLPGLVSATDDRFTSKMEKLMGTAKFVGNSYP